MSLPPPLLVIKGRGRGASLGGGILGGYCLNGHIKMAISMLFVNTIMDMHPVWAWRTQPLWFGIRTSSIVEIFQQAPGILFSQVAIHHLLFLWPNHIFDINIPPAATWARPSTLLCIFMSHMIKARKVPLAHAFKSIL